MRFNSQGVVSFNKQYEYVSIGMLRIEFLELGQQGSKTEEGQHLSLLQLLQFISSVAIPYAV